MNTDNQPEDYGLAVAIGFDITALLCVLAASKVPIPFSIVFLFLAVVLGIVGIIGTAIEISRSARK